VLEHGILCNLSSFLCLLLSEDKKVRSFVGEGNWNLRASGEGVVKE